MAMAIGNIPSMTGPNNQRPSCIVPSVTRPNNQSPRMNLVALKSKRLLAVVIMIAQIRANTTKQSELRFLRLGFLLVCSGVIRMQKNQKMMKKIRKSETLIPTTSYHMSKLICWFALFNPSIRKRELNPIP